jgi:hypothetical protein
MKLCDFRIVQRTSARLLDPYLEALLLQHSLARPPTCQDVLKALNIEGSLALVSTLTIGLFFSLFFLLKKINFSQNRQSLTGQGRSLHKIYLLWNFGLDCSWLNIQKILTLEQIKTTCLSVGRFVRRAIGTFAK